MIGIRKSFPGVVALDGVDLTLRAGEVHMLLGENGAGKSTLMKILSGAYRNDAGEIRIRDQAIEINSPRAALSLGIRVIYQELNLVPQLSVAENMFLGAAPTRLPGVIDWRRLRAGHDGAARRSRHGPRCRHAGAPTEPRAAADGGDREGASRLARACPSILVMDEPTSALTSREVDQPVPPDRSTRRARRRRGLHHAPARRGVSHRPSRHGAARRPSRDDGIAVGRDGRPSSCG